MNIKTGIGAGVFFITSLVVCGYLMFNAGKSSQLELDRVEWARLAAEAPVREIHDTVWVPGSTAHVGPTKPRPVRDTVFVDKIPEAEPTLLDTTINGIWLSIEYETPSALFPLGVYTSIDAQCPPSPVRTDSIFVPYPVAHLVEEIDWIGTGVIGGASGIFLFFMFLLISGGN